VGVINSILGVASSMQSTAATAATNGANATGAAGAAGAYTGVGGVGATPGATGSGSFGDVVVKALDGLQATQDNADGLAVKAATGDLSDVHNYTIAASEASLATDLTVALRDRAVEAFQSIMGMQV
jgi:flagellar hook-basal body complex protein FliE